MSLRSAEVQPPRWRMWLLIWLQVRSNQRQNLSALSLLLSVSFRCVWLRNEDLPRQGRDKHAREARLKQEHNVLYRFCVWLAAGLLVS
jgi:hypothetical protein